VRLFHASAAVALLALIPTARADEDRGAGGIEVKVYVVDAERNALPVSGIDLRLFFERGEGTQKTSVKVKAEPVQAGKAAAKVQAPAGGQVLPVDEKGADKRSLKLVIASAHGHADGGHDHGGGHDDGHDDGHGHGGHDHGEAKAEAPHFKAKVDLVSYVCPMKCVKPQATPGQCAKCKMDLVEDTTPWQVVVVLTEGGKTKNVKGFKYPAFEVATTVEGALKQLDEVAAEVESLIQAGKLAEVHAAAERLIPIGRELPSLAGGKRAKVEPLAQKLAKHFQALDEAGDRGDKAGTERALKDLRETIVALKRAAS